MNVKSVSHASRTGAKVIRRLPFTLAFLAVMLVANALAGTFSGQIDPNALATWGISVDVIRGGDPLRFATAIFLSHDLPMLLRQLLFAAIVIGAAEWLWGSWRTAGLFFGIDLTATVILLATVALIPGLAALKGVTDVGMSMGGFGLIGVLVASTRKDGVVGLIAVLGFVAAKYAIAPDPLADGGHAIAVVIGFGIGLCGPRIPGLANEPETVQQLPVFGRAGWHSAERRSERSAEARQQDEKR
ncbi:hypothetical protein [Oricola indica]|uniref:hypothetical protein n=1 Tax=Oricola indica TaxID=2872591 RepID=UPI003CCBDB54